MQKLHSWSPLHFLAALGSGGMSVAFFNVLDVLGAPPKAFNARF